MKKILLIIFISTSLLYCKEEKSEDEIKTEAVEKFKRLNELNFKLENATKSLEFSRSELNKISGFKLLRSGSDRDSQIRNAEKNIKVWQERVTILKDEIQYLETSN